MRGEEFMKKWIKNNFVLFFTILTVIIFTLYEKYLAKIILFFNIPYIPNTRTVQSTFIKYIPVMILLSLILFMFYKYFNKNNNED